VAVDKFSLSAGVPSLAAATSARVCVANASSIAALTGGCFFVIDAIVFPNSVAVLLLSLPTYFTQNHWPHA